MKKVNIGHTKGKGTIHTNVNTVIHTYTYEWKTHKISLRTKAEKIILIENEWNCKPHILVKV